MKVIGIIAEYNPFHNGHRYQIEQAKQASGADYVIAVMSPDFVQRGEPALCDRYIRARSALENGVDLCLSLPVWAACASAEYFAEAGVRILDRIGVTDHLSFGCEYPFPERFEEVIDILNNEPADYKKTLSNLQKKGMPFPAARQQALVQMIKHASCTEISGTTSADPQTAAISNWFENPNCTLGIEYLRSLKRIGSTITPLPVLRKGSGYHDPGVSGFETDHFPSATGLRTFIQKNGLCDEIRSGMPGTAFDLLAVSNLYHPSSRIYDRLLHYRLLTEKDYAAYLDISEDLASRIEKLLPEYTNAESFAASLKTRQITLTRIQRALLHIFLGIRKEQVQIFHHSDALYAHILGFRKEAAPLLHAIRQNSSIPVLGRASDGRKMLSDTSLDMFTMDLKAASLYQLLLHDTKTNTKMRSEYTRSPVSI